MPLIMRGNNLWLVRDTHKDPAYNPPGPQLIPICGSSETRRYPIDRHQVRDERTHISPCPVGRLKRYREVFTVQGPSCSGHESKIPSPRAHGLINPLRYIGVPRPVNTLLFPYPRNTSTYPLLVAYVYTRGTRIMYTEYTHNPILWLVRDTKYILWLIETRHKLHGAIGEVTSCGSQRHV